jgi:hypothetical protein
MTDIYDQVTGGELPPPEYVLTEEQRQATTPPIEPAGEPPVMYADKSTLFRPHLPEEDVSIDSIGTVRVRALSRAEAMRVTGSEMAKAKLDRYVISRGMIRPLLTEDEVGEWQKVSAAGDIEKASRAIMRVSGLEIDAPKSVVPDDDDET